MFTPNYKTSLNQGKQFRTMKKMFNKAIKNIGKSNYVGIEGIDDVETKMEVLTKSFRQTLGEYEEAFRIHLSGAANDERSIIKHYGKTLKSDGKIYWITNKGIKRELKGPISDQNFTSDDALTDAHFCPRKEDDVNKIIDLFETGEPLKYVKTDEIYFAETGKKYIWQKCDNVWENGGYFIKESGQDNGQLAWYDYKGKKHLFKSGLSKDNVHNSCPKRDSNRPTKDIDQITWGLMNKSNTILDKNTPCPGVLRNNVPSVLQLNNRLIDIAQEMKGEINKINNRNSDTKESSNDAHQALTTLITKIEEQRNAIKNLKKEVASLDTSIIDNKHLVKSINLRYISWGISLVTISLLIIHQIKK